MLRRTFLTIACSFLSIARANTQKSSGAKVLVLDQSGIFGEPDFVFGSWLISDEVTTRKEIASLRKSAKYRRRLSYRSTDRLKKKFAQGVLRNLLTNPRNTVRLVSFKPTSHHATKTTTERYTNFLEKEIEAAVSGVENFTIICQRRFSGNLDNELKKKLIARVSGLKEITYKKEREEPLVQCLGQLTGCAYNFVNGEIQSAQYGQSWQPNKTKQQLKLLLQKEAGLNFPWISTRHHSLLITTRLEN